MVFQSPVQCLSPGQRIEFNGSLQQGQRYVLAVKRLRGSARLVLGIGYDQASFRGTDRENENGVLMMPYVAPRSGAYSAVVGATSGADETCFVLAIFIVREGQ